MAFDPPSDTCVRCGVLIPHEWIAPVLCEGRLLAGTGTWRSTLLNGRCEACNGELAEQSIEQRRRLASHQRLVELGGGERAYQEFRLESFIVEPGNEQAFLRAQGFNPERDNLYLWGACGVGKTHLAFAAVRIQCERNRSVEFLTPPQLLRRVRRRDADDEQRRIDSLIRADVFALDDIGIGPDSAYARQVFQEILDGRYLSYRAGLIVTSRYSLDDLAQKLGDDAIPSRLSGLCAVVEVQGPDRRLRCDRKHDGNNSRIVGSSKDLTGPKIHPYSDRL